MGNLQFTVQENQAVAFANMVRPILLLKKQMFRLQQQHFYEKGIWSLRLSHKIYFSLKPT